MLSDYINTSANRGVFRNIPGLVGINKGKASPALDRKSSDQDALQIQFLTLVFPQNEFDEGTLVKVPLQEIQKPLSLVRCGLSGKGTSHYRFIP